MDGLKTYRNIRARLHVLAGALEFTPPTVVAATVAAADERILARQVEPGETVYSSNGQLIPEGHYAIVDVDEEGLTIIAADAAFFDLIWELDRPRN